MVNARKPTLRSLLKVRTTGSGRAILPSHREEQMRLRRREFIAGLGGAAAWPLAAGAQQPGTPVIGYLSGRARDTDASLLVSFRRGLADFGYVEGRNFTIEYRFTDGRYDRLFLLRHIFLREFRGKLRAHAGHRGSRAWPIA